MSEDKKKLSVKEKEMANPSCDSKQPQTCNQEDTKKGLDKAVLQLSAKKETAQQNIGHKHGGGCSH